MAGISNQLVLFHGSGHYWGYQFTINISRVKGDQRVHVTGWVNTGAWNIINGASWEGAPMTGYINIGGTVINVSHPGFDCRGGGCPSTLFNTTNIDFWTGAWNSSTMNITGSLSSPIDGAVNGSWNISGIPPYEPACDPDPVGPWGNPYATAPNHSTNPNQQPSMPKNIVLGKYYTSQSEIDIYYPKTTLEQVYRYAPMIRANSSGYTETDAFNIPFDIDQSIVQQKWGYYDNTYFYIYRTGLYDVACSAYIIDRKQGVGPKVCKNISGNTYAWLKIARNPYTHQNKNQNGENTDTSPACEWLTGRVSHNFRAEIMLECRNLLWLNEGDKLFARIGWQYGNGNGYNFQCKIGGTSAGYPTRMMITPLMFQDEDIEF